MIPLKPVLKGILVLVLTGIAGSVVDQLAGAPVGRAVKDVFFPPAPDLKIEPVQNLQVRPDGTYAIRVELTNNGTKALENVVTYYNLSCYMRNVKPTWLSHGPTLDPGETDYIEVPAEGFNPNCIPETELRFDIYRDSK